MKTTLRLFLTCLGIMTLFTFSSNAQRGKEGNATITTTNNVVNTYTNVTAVTGTSTLTVGNNAMLGGAFGGALAPGDLIMIVQMQGAVINCDVYPYNNGWGSYTVPAPYRWPGTWYDHAHEWGALIHLNIFGNPTNGYGTAGKFEQVEVLSITGGNTIEVICDLENTYNTGSGHVQIVRVPRYDTLTVTNTGSITPGIWDGTTGGIVALEVDSHLDVYAGGLISADAAGFRGGELDDSGTSGSTGNLAGVGFLGTPDPFLGSEKGEGIHGYHVELDALFSRYGISAASNGGGGGSYQNCGGGGGSNVYSGALRYTGTGVPNPIYNVNWALDNSYPDLNVDAQTWSNLVGRPSPGGGRGGYSLAAIDNNENVLGPRQAAWGGDARKENGGRGGHPLVYDATRLYMGGGGGAGDQDSDQGGRGGVGGGIVYITTYGTFIGDGTVSANGEDGEKSNPLNQDPGAGGVRKGHDGAGGGGGGGSIFIENAVDISPNILLQAEGGDGGDQDMRLFQAPGPPFPVVTTDEASGPGGSGGGGNIAFNSGTPIQSAVAGAAGTITSQNYEAGVYTPNAGMVGNFPVNGATDGYVGELSLPAPYFDIVGTDATICLGQSVDLSVVTLGAFGAGLGNADITWYTQQFCDPATNIQGTDLTINVTPAVTTTYWVGLCPGKWRIPVTVTVMLGANLVTTDPAPLCAPATADITLPAVTVGSDLGTLTYWQDNGATIVEPTPTAVGAGWYYIQLDVGGGCTAIDSVLVTINPLEDASFTYTPTCEGGIALITGTPGGTFIWNPAPGDAAILNAGTGAITNGVLGTTYFVEYTTAGPCPVSLTQSVTAFTDLAYTVTLTDENCGAGDGIIDLVASGGTGAPYQYSITGGAPYSGSGNFTLLGAGAYNISILDASGCEVTGLEVLSTSGAPSIDNVAISEPSCAGACDGIITLTVSGGTPPYSYQWYDNLLNPIGTDSPILSGQCAGDFSVDVTDASGGAVVYFSEDFGADGVACSSQGTLATGYNSGVGAWTTTATGFNEVDANIWFVSTMEAGVGGTGPGFCSDGCGLTPGLTDRTLHLSNVDIPALLVADQGAAYNAGGLCGVLFCIETDIRAESPAINLAGTNMTLTFDYIHQSDGTDECELMYYDGGAWNSLGVLPNTVVGGCVGQHEWAQYSWPVPAILNGVPNFQLGFRWSNNDDGLGADPSVAIDNIQVIEPGVACPANALATLTDPPAPILVTTDPLPVCAPSTADITLPAVTVGSDAGTLTYWQDNGATIVEATPTAVGAGWHYIQLDVAGCTVIDSVLVTVNPLDDASFTSADFCESTVNTISGIAIPGGTFTIQSQTGSGLATINAGTGVLANFVAGDQITIEYTTPAGGCQNSSTQVVNVLPNDDASFTSVDFCVSAVNVISAVATPGGVFVIIAQTGSGLVTINAGTGVLANYVAGDQVTIEYTTTGPCPNTSTQIVNVTALDDASFTSSDFCESTVNTISAVALPGGVYTIQSQTGSGLATINAGTGVLANYVAGDQVTIEYTTAGPCPNTSTQVVNVLPFDDASFTSADFCESTVNTISGIAIPGGAFSITSQTGSGLATINAGTGVLANFVVGDQITIQYTTPAGGCQNTSTQVVTVLPNDDASFTTVDFCESSVNVISAVATPGGTYVIIAQTGSGLVTINAGTGILANYVAGDQVTIEYTTNGPCPNTSTQIVNITALDDASFTTVDFCVSSVNVISAVAVPGGTYVIQSQTGSGLATINAGTGILANYVAGDQITIEYTTPAGGCQNTSTQIVNVTNLDDASFTTVDFCVSTVNTISAVALPGGTYIITGQTGSGLATINAGTGVLANFVAGDQITIEYTTPAGACQNTSTQIVNVIPLDDASFTSVDFCESSVNVISAVTLPGGIYSITSQTGSGLATINAGTGVLANFVAGDQITIQYTTPAGGCQNTSTQVVTVLPFDDASFTSVDFCVSAVNVISAVALPGGTYTITGQTGSGLATITAGTGVLANYVAGDQVTIEYTTAGPCPNTSTQIVNVIPMDDASFTSVDFCVSAVNVISGVALPGGVYVIQSQIGSGLATINAGTGVLANFVAGDQITIEYTTPAGGCQNTSTQVVNVTPLDDASFTSVDFCESSVNVISAVATPGGTYTIQSQTGSGLATITAGTGVLANYVAGDQVTIEYTTAGPCPNTSTQIVNVTALDDASFTSIDFCESTVNTISAVALPGGTYVITGQTGSGLATITAGTGVLANFVAGDQITIEYTTPAGACQNTSTQIVNVLPYDDASFTSIDFCESAVNVISAVALPGGVYVITGQTGSGLATINAGTGVLANFVAGDQITIEYTTPAGGCQNTSTQVVTVLPYDDASFTTFDFCESSVNIISAVGTPGGTYAIIAQSGSGLVTITAGTGVLANYVAGDQITIEYTTNGPCPNTSTQIVNVTAIDDASFTTVDFCESTVNTISAVVTPGGTYVITGQTGSGLATITAGTGVLANFVAGDQVTIEYTTPAGACQNTSTQIVNVLPYDDASFTTIDFCESAVNIISGVAIAGGTYVIQSQTGSGLATINGSTGVLANYVAGDQITIEYTTPAGGCQNTSTQVVNVLPYDDASFTSVDFCESAVNVISAVASPGGTYAIIAQSGSGLVTITAGTGVLANFVAGDQVTIEYTTNGACPNTSTQIVNVTALDDASFTSVDFCEGSVNVISAIAIPGGTFVIIGQIGSGLATIDGNTGVLSNFVAGDQIIIGYTTPAGACQNGSTQVVNVTPLDDASFTSVDFCENAVNVISAVAVPGGTYVIQSQTGSGLAIINASTGILSNQVAGDQITIEYTTPAGGCQNTSTQLVNVTPMDDASFTTLDFCESSVNIISAVAIPGGTYVITSQTGSGTCTIDGNTGILSNYIAGDQITIEYTTPAGGCQNTSTQVVNVTTQDDASFTSVDFCESSVNVISAVAVVGGAYAITAQTGAATIDMNTGVLSGFVAGDQITIQYTTPAGACQNASTQVVNVLATDDASFTMTATCDGGTALVTGLAGGTFAYTNAPTDGAILDPNTGTISSGTNGNSYDIEYTTTGACPGTSMQTVVALPLDDASFTLVPTCDGAIATVSGTAGGTFTFVNTPTDAAVLDVSTGDITGGSYNSDYLVEYLTAGACPDSLLQDVTVDDCSVSIEIVIPTAFTPGDIAVNGTWEVQDLDNNYPDNTVIVYNRWGNVVFEHSSSVTNPYSANRWDGTYKGQDLPVASYYYVIDANDGSGETFKGTVTIVRNY